MSLLMFRSRGVGDWQGYESGEVEGFYKMPRLAFEAKISSR